MQLEILVRMNPFFVDVAKIDDAEMQFCGIPSWESSLLASVLMFILASTLQFQHIPFEFWSSVRYLAYQDEEHFTRRRTKVCPNLSRHKMSFADAFLFCSSYQRPNPSASLTNASLSAKLMAAVTTHSIWSSAQQVTISSAELKVFGTPTALVSPF